MGPFLVDRVPWLRRSLWFAVGLTAALALGAARTGRDQPFVCGNSLPMPADVPMVSIGYIDVDAPIDEVEANNLRAAIETTASDSVTVASHGGWKLAHVYGYEIYPNIVALDTVLENPGLLPEEAELVTTCQVTLKAAYAYRPLDEITTTSRVTSPTYTSRTGRQLARQVCVTSALDEAIARVIPTLSAAAGR
jgi:hypothetical protein